MFILEVYSTMIHIKISKKRNVILVFIVESRIIKISLTMIRHELILWKLVKLIKKSVNFTSIGFAVIIHPIIHPNWCHFGRYAKTQVWGCTRIVFFQIVKTRSIFQNRQLWATTDMFGSSKLWTHAETLTCKSYEGLISWAPGTVYHCSFIYFSIFEIRVSRWSFRMERHITFEPTIFAGFYWEH
jgi:hypothetical protein